MLGQETTQITSLSNLIGTFLIILSVAILFTDKVTTFGITQIDGYNKPETFIWLITQSISPIILCVSFFFKPLRVFYLIPVYFFFIQVYWVFDYNMPSDDPLLHIYAAGFCVGVVLFIFIATHLITRIASANEKLLLNIKKLTRHIGINIKSKYIQEEDKKDYLVDTIEVIDSLD